MAITWRLATQRWGAVSGINYTVQETGRASGLGLWGQSAQCQRRRRPHGIVHRHLLCEVTRGEQCPRQGVAAGSSGGAMEVRLGGGR